MEIPHVLPVLLFGSDEKLPAPPGLLSAVLHAHSGVRYLILIGLIAAVFLAFNAMRKDQAWDGSPKRLGRLTMILADIQLLMGIFLWVYFIYLNTGLKMKRLKDMLGMQEVRFMAVEHAVMMFIAIVLIHIGYIRAKKAPSVRQANKSQFLFYLIALIMILVAIPWPFYGHMGRGWF